MQTALRRSALGLLVSADPEPGIPVEWPFLALLRALLETQTWVGVRLWKEPSFLSSAEILLCDSIQVT